MIALCPRLRLVLGRAENASYLEVQSGAAQLRGGEIVWSGRAHDQCKRGRGIVTAAIEETLRFLQRLTARTGWSADACT